MTDYTSVGFADKLSKIYKEAVDKVEQQIFEEFKQCKTHDERENVYFELKALGKLSGKFKKVINSNER